MTQLFKKYSVWWTFKNDSNLKQYLLGLDYFLDTYFTPAQLFDILEEIFYTKYLFDTGNSSLIVLDQNLQDVFETKILYKPKLIEYCLPHIDLVPSKKAFKLRNQKISNEFVINSPIDIIYNDPSSIFWLHPIVKSLLINKHQQQQQITFTWTDLTKLFLNSCFSNSDHFFNVTKDIVSINPTSPFAKLFKTQYFHIYQCQDILKLVTKFLGRTNTINNICQHLHFTMSKNNPVFEFIDDVINNCHTLSPDFCTYFYI